MGFGKKGHTVVTAAEREKLARDDASQSLAVDLPDIATPLILESMRRVELEHVPRDMDPEDLAQDAYVHLLQSRAVSAAVTLPAASIQARSAVRHVIADIIRRREAEEQSEDLPAWEQDMQHTRILRGPTDEQEYVIKTTLDTEKAFRFMQKYGIEPFEMDDLVVSQAARYTANKPPSEDPHKPSTLTQEEGLSALVSWMLLNSKVSEDYFVMGESDVVSCSR